MAPGLPGPSLRRGDGTRLGQIERIRVEDGRLLVSGWAQAGTVVVTAGQRRAETHPSGRRDDMASVLGGRVEIGFEIDLPYDRGPVLVELISETGEALLSCVVPMPSALRRAWKRMRLRAGFGKRLVTSLPDLWRIWRTGSPAARERLKTALHLDSLPPAPALRAGLLFGAEPARVPKGTVTVVVPVYGGHEMALECLERMAAGAGMPWRAIVIEDASPDGDTRPALQAWAETARAGGADVTLIENEENLGFVGSVNHALDLALRHGDPVVLLNSDAFLPEGWAPRLLRPLADPEVASVTPMSNDATILSVPSATSAAQLSEGDAEAIDALARRIALPPVQLPTAVGFCMAISPAWLRRLPRFDSAFGRGYGEEVDWCQKVRAMGGTHLAVPDLFVEHRGGGSFGSEEKRRLEVRAGREITRRYPQFDAQVQSFLKADPLAGPRLALSVAWAARHASGPVPIYLAHTMGGGAEDWLQRRLSRDVAELGAAMVLRVGGPSLLSLELHAPNGGCSGRFEGTALLHELLEPLAPGMRRIVYSCGVGHPDPITIPDLLLSLRREGDELEMLFHDWFPISPSYTLLGSDSVYRGTPVAGGALSNDPAHGDLKAWQSAWGRLAAACDAITVFTEGGRVHIERVWPEAAPRLRVRGHEVPTLPGPLPPRPEGASAKAAVLGNLNLQKGAGVIDAMARRAGPGDPEIVVIGKVDPAYVLPPRVHVHGAYDPAEIASLAERYAVGAWIMPAIWPETFSFAAREALSTGLPVLVFDIGAQGEAARASPNGVVVPLGADADPAHEMKTTLRSVLGRG